MVVGLLLLVQEVLVMVVLGLLLLRETLLTAGVVQVVQVVRSKQVLATMGVMVVGLLLLRRGTLPMVGVE